MIDPLVTMLREPALRRFLDRLRKRLVQHGELPRRMTLHSVTDGERRSLKSLTGQAVRGHTARIDLGQLNDLVQRTGRFDSLDALVEAAADAALRNQRQERDEHDSAWQQMWDEAYQRCDSRTPLLEWPKRLRRTGWLKQRCATAAAAESMLQRAHAVLDQLPRAANDSLPLAVLAAQCCGDAHALDSKRDLGRLVLRGVAALARIEIPDTAGLRRQAWQSVGIVQDELSTTVLVWNLPGDETTLVGRTLRDHATLGVPLRLTFAQLRLYAPATFPIPDGRPVFVCENPAVVAAAADRLGATGGPLVCVEGQPNLAVQRLLSLLSADGHRLLYHGDFDWGGIRIANYLMQRLPIRPWRFCAADYDPRSDNRPLAPQPVEASWDPQLAAKMRYEKRAVDEEAVLTRLLEDLSH
jgi:uncharacterized protein (TIGR02679 family)